jgi:Family of unknown function (DUF6361)
VRQPIDGELTRTPVSRIAWMDYSEAQRRRMREAIDLLSEKGILDELGVGTIRDAISDALFPGTSTIQTRARYFLFIPWIYREAERLKVSSARIEEWRRGREFALTKALLASGAVDGAFGRQAGESLRRLASEVYWLGLGVWGIRRATSSQQQYHRSLDALYVQTDGARRQLRDDDGQPLEDGPSPSWHLSLPLAPDNFPEGVTFELLRGEADYLRDRIRSTAPTSFLNVLVGRSSAESAGALPWQHPAVADAPAATRQMLDHARTFSELMHGASLTYNLMLARAVPNEAWSAEYSERLSGWAEVIASDPNRFAEWRLIDLLRALPPRTLVRGRTRDFVDTWQAFVNAAAGDQAALMSLPEDPRIGRLIRDREAALKGPEARLSQRRALERWRGAAGADQLAFRWSNIVVITRDINTGLSMNA